ncbi:MAG: D-tyrosyl-tRNA(Tyr) deacylase [Bacilli bacterium]|nr:D-tyrosyl-tRNA(Tyr) deacylase [Bacilli bacterium]
MKVLIQRSGKSNVSIDGAVYNEIESGLVVFSCFTQGDTSSDIDYIVRKIVNLRIFDDENGVMNKSVLDVGGSILSISQFTLYADTVKGNRPSYLKALKGDESTILYDEFNEKLREHVPCVTGKFGADMKVNILNDGPVTIIIDSKENGK